MNILYIGDIMAGPGVEAVRQVLPEVRREHGVDLVIAQAENVTEGRGLSPEDYAVLKSIGVDACTGGNWTLHRPEINPFLDNADEPVIRPANYPEGTPGQRYKYVDSPQGRVLIVSLMGHIVGRDADRPVDNPLKVIDDILEQNQGVERVATIVNLHGDFSSEKVIIGYYLDGRVTAAVGDHWHVPTADAMVLPNGTAHITDVGMCGVLHASLGVSLDSVIPRWRDGHVTRNQMATERPWQFNAVLIEIDTQTALAKSIQPVRKILS